MRPMRGGMSGVCDGKAAIAKTGVQDLKGLMTTNLSQWEAIRPGAGERTEWPCPARTARGDDIGRENALVVHRVQCLRRGVPGARRSADSPHGHAPQSCRRRRIEWHGGRALRRMQSSGNALGAAGGGTRELGGRLGHSDRRRNPGF